MRRWTPEEVAAERAALNSVSPEAAQAATVSMRLVVYLAQRYLPASDNRTEAEWRETQRRLRRKVRRAIATGASNEFGKEWIASINAELERKRSIMNSGYSASMDDHWAIFVPIYQGVAFFPEPTAITLSNESIRRQIYHASSSDYHTSREAQCHLMGSCDVDAVAEFSKAVRKNYETARRSKEAGYSKLRMIAGRRCCDRCKSVDGAELEVEKLLYLYQSRAIDFPHELPSEDVASYCLGPALFPVAEPTSASARGVNPEFSASMDAILKAKRDRDAGRGS